MKKKTLNIGIIVIVIFFIFLIFHWKSYYVRSQINRHDKKIERTIRNIVRENIRNDFPALSIPHITIDTLVIVQSEQDSTVIISKLYDDQLAQIESSITNYFIEYYRKQDSISKIESLVPFIIYPNEIDSSGNLILQAKDLENIKNHILFLSNNVDKAIEGIKRELSNDIERLNLWTSIWIGILGIFGALFPLVITYKSQTETRLKFVEIKNDIERQESEFKEEHKADRLSFKTSIKNAKQEADEVSRLSNEASEKSITALESIEKVSRDSEKQKTKIDGLDESLAKMQTDIDSKNQAIVEVMGKTKDLSVEIIKAKDASGEALEKSNAALKSSKELKSVVYLSNSLGNLKQMDFYKVQLYHTKLETYLAVVFEKIQKNLSDFSKNKDSDLDILFKELIRDFILSLRQIRNFLKQRLQLKSMDLLDESLNSLLEAKRETLLELLDDVDNKLDSFIKSLRNNE